MIVATDTETYEKKEDGYYYPVLDATQYTLGVTLTEDKEQKVFFNAEEHWAYLMKLHERQKKKEEKLYIYGHHHIYDFIAYAKAHLTDKELKRINDSQLLYIWDETTYFLDTRSFYKMSLEEVGELIGYKKGIMPKKVKNLDEIVPYCIRDVEITLKAVLYIKESLNKLGYKPKKLLTAGQLAMTTFLSYARKKNIHWHFMKDGKIFRCENFRVSRVALRGGRVEAFQKGKYRQCTQIDINSLYPYIMKIMQFPKLDQPLLLKNPKFSDWEMIRQCIGVAEVQIECDLDKDMIPYLPIHYKGKQIYPKKCCMVGTWTIKELAEAEKIGYRLRSIHWAELYQENKVNPFTQYIDDFYKLRIRDETMKPVIKMILNNLFGKFAQYKRQTDTQYILRKDIRQYERLGYRVKGIIEEFFIVEKDEGEYIPPYSNPLISTLITAWARDYLYKQLIKIPKEDLLYCATDSIVFKGEHIKKYPISNKLGEFKIEEEKATAFIQGEQKYSIGNKIAISGLPKRDMKKDTLKLAETKIRRMISFRDAINMGDLSQIGKFKEFDLILNEESKGDIIIPEYIDERKDYKIIGEELEDGKY